MGLSLEHAMLVLAYKQGQKQKLEGNPRNPYALHATRQAWWAGWLSVAKELPY